MRPAAELGYRHGCAAASAVILCRAALFESPPPTGWQASIETGARAVFPVSAADLMPNLQGKALGDRLRMLEQEWIGSGFAQSKTDLLR
jgi:poly(A) polymerase